MAGGESTGRETFYFRRRSRPNFGPGWREIEDSDSSRLYVDCEVTTHTQSLLDEYKAAVRAWVTTVREVLDTDFAGQLKWLGIRPDGTTIPVQKMNLPQEAQPIRNRIEALLRRDSVSEGSPIRGYENILRELSYTCLNRLVGLKCMEASGLLYLPSPANVGGVPEQTEVITPVEGQARSRYLRDLRVAGGTRYKYVDDADELLLRDALTAAYRFITSEIQILFDPDHEYACVWPTYGCLVNVIAMINEDLPPEAYRAQDFLGWVYQFFNRKEKERVRDETGGKPRTSYELSVINQFYTPSWVVKVLIDNTLGRLWLQMHPESKLKPSGLPLLPDEGVWYRPIADYLVPHTGENIRFEQANETGMVQTFKRAKDIKLIDPACGTMHFGQYAFGLFHKMYLDEIEHAGEPGWPEAPSISDPRLIPSTVIEANLYGIDIDARAIQIASLSLLLTAKEAAIQHGFSPLDVHIRRTNLVVANAVNLGEDQIRDLVDRLKGPLGSPSLQHTLFKTIWDNLQNVGELGSLIQVREGVTRVLDQWVARQVATRGLTSIRAKDSPQFQLGTISVDWEAEHKRQLELERSVLEEEAQGMRDELLRGLQQLAQFDSDPSQRLFAEDTVRGLRLLDILSQQFDGAARNPSY